MIFSNALRKKMKTANERMRRLERAGVQSPAYRAIQGTLQMLGVDGAATGRRFSETGKFETQAQMRQMERIVNNFLGQNTSTVRGFRRYRREVMKAAEQRFDLSSAGISEDEYMQIWENLPDNENERLYGSDEIVNIVKEVKKQLGKEEDENVLNVGDIVAQLQREGDLKSTLTGLGLDPVSFVQSIGGLS